jgi:hypothetical protein
MLTRALPPPPSSPSLMSVSPTTHAHARITLHAQPAVLEGPRRLRQTLTSAAKTTAGRVAVDRGVARNARATSAATRAKVTDAESRAMATAAQGTLAVKGQRAASAHSPRLTQTHNRLHTRLHTRARTHAPTQSHTTPHARTPTCCQICYSPCTTRALATHNTDHTCVHSLVWFNRGGERCTGNKCANNCHGSECGNRCSGDDCASNSRGER